MEVWLDNVWASPTTLHLRVIILTGRGRRLIKVDQSVPLDEIEGLEVIDEITRTAREIDPTRDHQQQALF